MPTETLPRPPQRAEIHPPNQDARKRTLYAAGLLGFILALIIIGSAILNL